ncbi:MAG TPA: SDR family oxidoreductase [Acidimicrobiia bacterium]|nr:SDR family oxidoreductase [Acidimicrobiia bacterium]
MGGSSMTGLAGNVAIVTGAAGRLGAAAVKAFTDAGAAVLAADVDEAGAEAVCVRSGGAARACRVDVTSEDDVIRMVATAKEVFGGLDVIVNNAGVVGLEHGVDRLGLDSAEWDRIVAVHLRGVMLGCKHAIPALRERGGGSIINMSSGASLAGDVENYAYAAAKAGINTLTRYVAAGYGKDNIRCNAIAPGIHLSPDYLDSLDEERRRFYARLEDHCLLPRLGVPDDIAQTVLFLASGSSGYITGQVIQVDGGLIGHVPHLADVRRAAAAVG